MEDKGENRKEAEIEEEEKLGDGKFKLKKK